MRTLVMLIGVVIAAVACGMAIGTLYKDDD